VNLYHQFRVLWLRIPLRHKGAAIITIPIICLFIFLATSIYLRYYTTAASRYVAHTQDVLLESSSLLVALLNAETGVRGYESIGDKSFLEPYNAALISLPRSSTRLRELVRDNPQQLQRVQIIERGIQQELGLLRQAIARTESSPLPSGNLTQRNSSLINAKAAMDRLRQEIGDFQAVERQLLKIREQELVRQETLRGWAQLGMTVVSILASLGAIYLFDRIERDRQEGLRIMRSQARDLVQLNQVLAHTNVMLGDRNRELDQFAYVSSHDLKAPLRAIANLSEWIEEDLEGQASPEVQQHLSLLRRRVHRMEALINGLLDYSRVGRSQVPIETVNVATLLAEVIDSLDPPPTFRVEAKAMPTIQTRRLPLSQVFSNLISNAIKHCHRQDGKIWITAQQKNKFYEFSVSDNGQGIAPEHQTRIFTIFQTLEPRDKTENTGIGLSLVKKIVETEGGQVWVESELGKGATFRFTWSSLAIEPIDQGGTASEPTPLTL
jgi:signal transduction histidine kinase